LTAAGIASTPAGEGLSTEATPEQVGKAAAAAGVALVELRSADAAGLEEMFLELTAETQRDELTPEGATV
jgi:ABC-2 type transport system ATP-binding protein